MREQAAKQSKIAHSVFVHFLANTLSVSVGPTQRGSLYRLAPYSHFMS